MNSFCCMKAKNRR